MGARARWRESSFYVFRSNFFATLSWQIRRANAPRPRCNPSLLPPHPLDRGQSPRGRVVGLSSNWLIPDITSGGEEDEEGGFSRDGDDPLQLDYEEEWME